MIGKMRSTPRLLYLARSFRPAPNIGGVRSWNTAVHLTNAGWDVNVVTPHPGLWLNPEDPPKVAQEVAGAGFRRTFTDHHRRALVCCEMDYPVGWLSRLAGGIQRRVTAHLRIDPRIGWVTAATRALVSISRGDVDLILATGPPFVAFGLASRLARKLDCPFVLDYRDPWNGDPHVSRPDAPRAVREEGRVLRACAAATVVSPSWARMIGERYGVMEKMHVVSNGFDPDMFRGVEPIGFDHFAVVYAGTFYPPKRVLDPVLLAFRDFVAAHPEYRSVFHYYGHWGEHFREAAARAGVAEHTVSHGVVPREVALAAQKGAAVTVVVTSIDEHGTLSDNGMVTGKVFDCIALGTPILLVAPVESDARLVLEATGGGRSVTGREACDMVRFLCEVASGTNAPRRRPDLYSWATIGCELDRVLRAALPYQGEGLRRP